MPLSGSVLGGLIKSNLQGSGASGSNLTIFSNALGNGIVNAITGKSFTTNDVGTGSLGTGTGTGVTGLSSSTMASLALAAMTSQGSNASAMMNAIMMAVVSHLSSAASLSSVDPAVGTGTGTIVVGSIAVTIPNMTSTIHSALTGSGANGANVPNLSLAIATGIVSNILSSGTGTLVISGGMPGGSSAGSGTGTIT